MSEKYNEHNVVFKVPRLIKINEGFELEYITIKSKKRINNKFALKDLIGDICKDFSNITTLQGIVLDKNSSLEYLSPNETLILSFDQFLTQYKYIEYLKKENKNIAQFFTDKITHLESLSTDKIKNLELTLSQERQYFSNLRNSMLHYNNLIGNQILSLPVIHNESKKRKFCTDSS